jgi:hypothetical protein
MATLAVQAASLCTVHSAFTSVNKQVSCRSQRAGLAYRSRSKCVTSSKKLRSSVRASAVSEDTSTDEITERAEKLLKDAKAKWDNVEDKTSVIIYAIGSIVVLTVANSILSAFDTVPLFGKLFEVVGLGYSGWFIYRYLLFTPNRQELYAKVDDVFSQISGETKEMSKEINEAAAPVKREIKDISRDVKDVTRDL